MTALRRFDAPMMTADEFLKWNGGVPGVVYELVDGVVRAQDAASTGHGGIHANLIRLIGNHLIDHHPRCRVIAAPGIRPHIAAHWNHRIPELAIACSQHQTGERHLDLPIVIVEVLSESNYRDTMSNVALYASLPSVQEILLVESTRVGAEMLRRNAEGSWPPDAVPVDPKFGLRIESFDLSLSFPDIYSRTSLEDEARAASGG